MKIQFSKPPEKYKATELFFVELNLTGDSQSTMQNKKTGETLDKLPPTL